MKKIVLVLALLFFSVNIFAQKAKYDYDKKTEIGTKNGDFYCKVIQKRGTVWSYRVIDKNDVEQMKIVFKSYKSPMAVSQSNPNGTVSYTLVIFPEYDLRAEAHLNYAKTKKLIKNLDKNELFVDGLLNEKAMKDFVEVNGMQFSKKIQY